MYNERRSSMTRGGTKLTTEQDRGRLSPCVCNTLRMVTRVVTQLYDDVLRPSGLLLVACRRNLRTRTPGLIPEGRACQFRTSSEPFYDGE